MTNAFPDLHNTMQELSKIRPVFHSEADFQHALAWELQKSMPLASVRIERPFRLGSQSKLEPLDTKNIDIFVRNGDANLAIELKYKTKTTFPTTIKLESDEGFTLTQHAAQNWGSFYFLNDIDRLETITDLFMPNCVGWAIFLTNDKTYWSSPVRPVADALAFRLTDGRKVKGQLAWGYPKGGNQQDGKKRTLTLKNSYKLKWKPYVKVVSDKNAEFKYLAVKIANSN